MKIYWHKIKTDRTIESNLECITPNPGLRYNPIILYDLKMSAFHETIAAKHENW